MEGTNSTNLLTTTGSNTLAGSSISTCLPFGSYQGYCYTTPTTGYYPYQIRPVANGFIVYCEGHEHVFNKQADLLKFLTEKLKIDKN